MAYLPFLLPLIFLVSKKVVADDDGASALHEYFDRMHPLRNLSVSVDAIPWHKYHSIIITGPQRSGTTYFSQELAAMLGYVHLDEMDKHTAMYNTSNHTQCILPPSGQSDIQLFPNMLETNEKTVLQRPQWSDKLDLLPLPDQSKKKRSRYLVAFLSRNCLDVYRSQNALVRWDTNNTNTGWTCQYGRKKEWGNYNTRKELSSVVDSMHDMICTIKQQAFLRYQLPKMRKLGIETVVVDFNSFSKLKHFVTNHSSFEHHNKAALGFNRDR